MGKLDIKLDHHLGKIDNPPGKLDIKLDNRVGKLDNPSYQTRQPHWQTRHQTRQPIFKQDKQMGKLDNDRFQTRQPEGQTRQLPCSN